MLTKFSVENFKCFKNKFTLDLSKPGNYEFNTDAIRNGVVDKGIIYGINGIGKSNLGLAIFDIVNTLTDKCKTLDKYVNFINLDSDKSFATFEYEFRFDNDLVTYIYQKKAENILLSESLKINGKEMLFYDYREKNGFSRFQGSENLNLNSDNTNSRVKYILETAILVSDNTSNRILFDFKDFVNRMLLFYSLKENNFIGFKVNGEIIENIIINANKVNDFQDFINSQGLHVKLAAVDTPEGKKLYFNHKNGLSYFFAEASTGMTSLALLYSWLISLEKCSFVYIDEFDAFYHYELSESIIKILKRYSHTQIFVTTHNTDLMSNDLLRPDSYFILTDQKIDCLNRLTEKDLRLAHNLQKMFKSGAFNE